MKKKQEAPSINFSAALQSVADSRGISKETVVDALKEALARAFIKNYLQGGDDANVKVDIDEDTGKIYLAQVKRVVDEVEDDYLEISADDANAGLKKGQKRYKPGDDYEIPCPVEELGKMTAMAVKSMLRQNLAEAERSALYDLYKDHIGEMITGTVEKADDRSVTVDIGRTSVEVGRRDLIGDEMFKVGDSIKVYLQEVKSAAPETDENGRAKRRGPQIEVTRSSEGFLRCLFEEEIHEIYDGTVVIKAIAREAGVRSKVAVYSTNEDVDATGACIGAGGSRIQKVVSQLGNGKEKEKIDVINYVDNPGCFVIEALRPAQVLGVNLSEDEAEGKKAVALIRDDQKSVAIGKKAANVRLASKITGYSINLMTESEAAAQGVTFKTAEQWQAESDQERRAKEKALFLDRSRARARAKAEALPQSAVAPKAGANAEEFPAEAANPAAAAVAQAKAEDRRNAELAAQAEASSKQVSKQAGFTYPSFEAHAVSSKRPGQIQDSDIYAESEQPSSLTEEAAPEAPEAAEAPAPEAEQPSVSEQAPAQPTFVHTTTTLTDLEKELESSKEKKPAQSSYKHHAKSEEKKPEAKKPAAQLAQGPAVPVYTQEELERIAAEEAEAQAREDSSDDDIDYEDYDQYYDDDDGSRR